MSLPEYFNAAEYFVDRNVEEGRGDALAVLYQDQAIPYRIVREQVRRAASLFRLAGVQSGDRIILILLDSPAFVWAFWGAILAGAVPVPLNTLFSPEECDFVIRDSESRFLVVHDRLVEKVSPSGRQRGDLIAWVAGERQSGLPAPLDLPLPSTTLRDPERSRGVGAMSGVEWQAGFKSFEEELGRSSGQALPARTRLDDPAFWLYTSGSTGNPKAAIHRHRDMVCCLETYAKQVLQISSADRTFSTSKLFFAYGLGNALYFPFGVGASTILLSERPQAEAVMEVITRSQPTIFYAVPTIYAAMLQVPNPERYDLRSIRCAVSAGEALPAPLFDRFRERFGISILDGIGSTEMLHMFISNRIGDIKPGSCGREVPGYEARIVDERGDGVPPSQIGELLIRGDSRAAGYWKRPDLTQATFRGEWTATGDKFVKDERGYFWFCGRSDDMLKVSGLWVSPLEIESALLTHPSVLECAVVGAADNDGLIKPKAFVVLKSPACLSGPAPPAGAVEAELNSFLRAKLPSYKVPRWLVLTEGLPRTATGKVQRFKLRSP